MAENGGDVELNDTWAKSLISRNRKKIMKKRTTKASENKRNYGPGVEKAGLKNWIFDFWQKMNGSLTTLGQKRLYRGTGKRIYKIDKEKPK